LVVSRAQGEYEALEKEREEQEAGLGKRGLEDGQGEPAAKKIKTDEEDDEEEMEIEMEDDEDGECLRLGPVVQDQTDVSIAISKWSRRHVPHLHKLAARV
jgi:hypothetical protein